MVKLQGDFAGARSSVADELKIILNEPRWGIRTMERCVGDVSNFCSKGSRRSEGTVCGKP